MGRKLLVDSIGVRLDQLSESAAPGEFIFKGKFAQSDTPTANKRVYPRALWEREIARLKGKMMEGKVFGELDHPEDGKTKLQRVAILVQDLALDRQGQVIGQFKILDTTMGRELKAIVEGGGAVGVSSRGYGSVRMNEDGNAVVQDDFTLLTFDPVADPAEETAYPELIKQEPEASEADEMDDDPEAERQAWKEEKQKVTTESVDRNKLNLAIKKAKSIYQDAIKESSHKDALQRAVEEGYRLIGKGYDAKDFAVEVAAEVMTVAKKPTMEEAGSDMDHAEIMNLIKASVQESIDSLLKEKDQSLTEANARIQMEVKASENLKKDLSEAHDRILKLHDVTKELAYSLYLQQHLGRHPKLKQIKESLGDLCMIESLEALQNKVKVHISEVTKIIESEEQKIKQISEERKAFAEEKQKLEEALSDVTEERNEAVQIGLENAAALYLERKIQGNPYQVEMRKRFSEMREKTKESVNKLIEEYKGRRINESSDFHRVRRSLSHRPKTHEHDSLVENHVKETAPIFVEETLQLNGEIYNMTEIKRLSGIR